MNLEQNFQSFLSEQAYAVVKAVSQIASDLGQPVFLVGGAVRDLLLGRMSHDLDFVTEGSGLALAQKICEALDGSLTTHERFGTAVWTPPAQLFPNTVDVITARKEIYKTPAALPEVTPSNMQDDLFRRDFTINGMAIRLGGPQHGELLDLYHGQRDLEKKLIRVFHQQSFQDDPTRTFRAARYAGRLGFALADGTKQALITSLNEIKLLSADRVRHELEKTMAEPLPMPMLEILEELEILKAVDANLVWSDTQRIALAHLDGLMSLELGQTAAKEVSKTDLRLSTWLTNLPQSEETALSVANCLNVSADIRRDIEKVLKAIDASKTLEDLRPGTIEKLLRGLSAAQLTLLQANQQLPKEIKALIPAYFNQWRLIKTNTDGNTLRQLNLPPGPSYQKILDHLLAAKLNGEINSDSEENEQLTHLVQNIMTENKKSAS